MATDRRTFLLNTAKAGMAVCVGSSVFTSCAPGAAIGSSRFNTGFQQQPLPYGFGALEAAVDAKTMELHFTKHAAGYAANLNDAAKAEGVDTARPVEALLRRVSKYSAKMRNNAGGHYNHELFWKSMSPQGGGQPSGKLAEAINSSFGSFDAFKTQFTDAGKNQFGSGWAWLVIDGDRRLRIGSTPNQDNPLMDLAAFKGFPLLGLDVWEHAYYLRYQNRRPDYISNWWKVVDWNFVQERLAGVMA